MFLTRIESSSINGIPDVHGVHKQGVFWIELKSDKVIILKENLGKTLLQSALKLYRPVSLFTDPRSLVPFASFSSPYQWPTVQQHLLQRLVQRDSEQQVA